MIPLAAVASPQMSLKRHLETVIKPWLAANCRWVLSDRRLILGAIEDVEPQAEWTFTEILEDVIGGAWDPPLNPWESRRETMLDLFGKAKPFAMTPALQIDRQNARLRWKRSVAGGATTRNGEISAMPGTTWRTRFHFALTGSRPGCPVAAMTTRF